MLSAAHRAWAARIGAPVAFLVAVTIAVLLVRAGLREEEPVVPGAPATAASRSYVVRRGDTLRSIARRFDTTVADLQRLNPSLDPVALPVGRRIRVS